MVFIALFLINLLDIEIRETVVGLVVAELYSHLLFLFPFTEVGSELTMRTLPLPLHSTRIMFELRYGKGANRPGKFYHLRRLAAWLGHFILAR